MMKKNVMSEIDIRGDDALVGLLLNAEKGDIDLLIDYVTPEGKFNFSQADNVKMLLRGAKNNEVMDEALLRLLIRELQYFGGNTFVNLFRGNGVNYREIVDDVAGHLKIKSVGTASLEEKEAQIIDAVFTTTWKTLSDADRRQMLQALEGHSGANAEMSMLERAALVANSVAQVTAKKALPLAAGVAIGRLVGMINPLTLALTSLYTAYDLSSPAMRVTLPCVVQIAWIRLKNSRHFRLPRPAAATEIAPASYAARWEFVNEAAQPVLRVSALPASAITLTAALPEQDLSPIAMLSPLLQTLPSLATSAHLASHHYMEVVIDGALASASNGAGYRGFSLGNSGIKEHAVLLSPENLSRLVNAGMLLNVASAVLAQKHLADISAKLTQIIHLIQEVSAFQHNARKAEIISTIKYLQHTTPDVLAGSALPEIRLSLENIERQFSALQEHVLIDIAMAGDNIASLSDSGFFSSASLTGKIQAQQRILEQRNQEWDLTMRVRAQVLHLMGHAEEAKPRVARRQQLLEEDYRQFDQVIEKVEQQLQQRIEAINPRTEQSNTTLANKVLLRSWASQTLLKQKAAIAETRLSVAQAQQSMLSQPPIRVLVEIQAGNAMRCFALPPVQ